MKSYVVYVPNTSEAADLRAVLIEKGLSDDTFYIRYPVERRNVDFFDYHREGYVYIYVDGRGKKFALQPSHFIKSLTCYSFHQFKRKHFFRLLWIKIRHYLNIK